MKIQHFEIALVILSLVEITNALAFIPWTWSSSCRICKRNYDSSSSRTASRRGVGVVVSSSSTPSATSIRTISTGAPVLSSPPPLDSFALRVEQRLRDTFGSDAVSRIIQSWRLLDAGYEHRQHFVPEDPNSHFAQHAHSYVPGLTVQPFWDCSHTEWCDTLSSHYQDIRSEFLRVTKDMETHQRQQGSSMWAGATTQDAASYGKGWRTLALYDKGIWDAHNVPLFPITSKALRDSNIPLLEVFFASMEPHSAIQMHSDFTNFVLTSHLPLVIPQNGNNKCRITIGDETRQWIDGEVLMFDTSIMHDAINETNETRYILMLRVWHPDLTPVECEALQFLFDCLKVPELASSDISERFFAEQHLGLLRSFPDTSSKDTTSSTSTTTITTTTTKHRKSTESSRNSNSSSSSSKSTTSSISKSNTKKDNNKGFGKR